MSVKTFYAKSRWGHVFHQIRIINGFVSKHSGHDLMNAARTLVPALNAGTVTKVGRLGDIGQFVEVKVSSNLYMTYCHILPSVKVGQKIKQGQNVGKLAGAADGPGTAWTGPHLHLMAARTTGAFGNRAITIDPKPYILNAISGGGAGGGGVSIQETETDMFRMIRVKTGATSAGNLYDIYTDFATVTNVPYNEASAYNDMAKTQSALDGTSNKNASKVASVRSLWKRMQDANNAALAAAVKAAINGAVIAPTIDAEVIADATADEIDERNRRRLGQ